MGHGPKSVLPDLRSGTPHLLRPTRDHRGGLAPPRPFPVPPLPLFPPRGPPPPASHDGSEENPQGKLPKVGFGGSGCRVGRLSKLRPALPAVASAGLAASLDPAAGDAPAGLPSHPTPSDGAHGGPGALPALRPEVCSPAQRSFPASSLGPAWYGVPGPLPGLGLLCQRAIVQPCREGVLGLGRWAAPSTEVERALCPISAHKTPTPTCLGSLHRTT